MKKMNKKGQFGEGWLIILVVLGLAGWFIYDSIGLIKVIGIIGQPPWIYILAFALVYFIITKRR